MFLIYMWWLTNIVSVVIFVLCSPNIVTRLPKKGNKYLVALVHGVIFSLLLTLLSGHLPLKEGVLTSVKPTPPLPDWQIALIVIAAIFGIPVIMVFVVGVAVILNFLNGGG